MLVALVLLVSGVISAVLVHGGLALAVGASGWGWAPAVAVTLFALGLDFDGRIRPFAVGRQVPQAWGHRRRPSVVALRYGFRLGVAPATILTTWVWWAALVIGVGEGVAPSLAVGAAFVVCRTGVTVGVTVGVRTGVEMAARMAKVQAAGRRLRWSRA